MQAGSRRDAALVVIASLAFATSGPLAKVAVAVPPVTVACARTGIAALVLAVVGRTELRTSLPTLTRKQRGGLALAGALLAAHFVLFLGGLATTSLAAAVALVSLEPIAVVVLAFAVFGLRPTRRELAGLLAATVGAAVVASGAGQGEHRLLGDLMVLGAVVLYGAYVVAARGLREALPPVPYAAVVYGVASASLFPFAVVLAARLPEVPPARALAAVLAMALVPTLVGHTLVQRVARHAPPVLVALVSPGETLGSLLIGAILLGTAPTTREALGCVLVLAGAMLAVTGRRQSSTATTGA